LRHLIPQEEFNQWQYRRQQALNLKDDPSTRDFILASREIIRRENFGDPDKYFLSDSPLGKAMNTGFVDMGDFGKHPVTFRLIQSSNVSMFIVLG
ncbi:MAG: hypothetical protein JWP57_1905, partial [Spirosoma sp.]|nr:hypothetical protein [Spirosoma sp.]